MQQRTDEQHSAQRREHGSLRAAAATDLFGSHPRGALNRGDNAQKCGRVRHLANRTTAAWVVVAALGAVGLLVIPAQLSAAEAAPGTELSVALALLLGAIQGATEFLPVSSSGHLSVGQAWLGIDPATAGHRFNIVLHAGTLLAVAWVYRTDILALLKACARPAQASPDRRRLLMMLLASLPLGLALVPAVEHAVIAMESQVRWVGVAFWVTAAVLFFAFRNQERAEAPADGQSEALDEQPPSARQALLIGVAQLFAILPGISRSGSTIAAGIAVGLDRGRAARFSFLISLIAVGGAAAKEGLDVLSLPDPGQIALVPFAVGFASSLVVGLLSLRGLLYLVGRGKVTGFVIYLLVLGAVAIALG